MRNLMHHLTKKCNHRQAKQGKLNPACLDVQIDYDYLWGLYEQQAGLCALSGLQMVHKFNDLCSISIDRIDSDKGYVPGNVQLVCKWVNLAKQKHSNEDFVELLGSLRPNSKLFLGAPPLVLGLSMRLEKLTCRFHPLVGEQHQHHQLARL